MKSEIKVDQKQKEADIKVNLKQREADIEVETARRKAEIKNNAKAGKPEKAVEADIEATEQQPKSFGFADIKECPDRSNLFIDLMGVPFILGGAHLMASEAGVGKSTLAMAMAEEFARKKPYGSVLYFDTEPSDEKYELRYGKVKDSKPTNIRIIPTYCPDARKLADLIKKEVGKVIGNDVFVVLDNVTGYGDNQRKESEDFFKEMKAFRLQQKEEDLFLTTLYVAHMKQIRSSKEKGMGDVRCRPFLKDMSDMVMVLDPCKDEQGCIELQTVKQRYVSKLKRVYRLVPEEGNHHLERVDKEGEGDQSANQRPEK